MTDAQDLIRSMISLIGEDPGREGLKGTPGRVVRSWEKLYGGYKQDPKKILSVEFSEIENYDQMVWMTDIQFFSTCEHHMLPFFGKAHVAYIPKGKVVGASKLVRLVDCFARRLQIQERMTGEIANAMFENLNPVGCGVIVVAQHFCMTARGVESQEVLMKTSALRGVFNDQKVKDEFRDLCFNGGL